MSLNLDIFNRRATSSKTYETFDPNTNRVGVRGRRVSSSELGFLSRMSLPQGVSNDPILR